MPASKVYIMSLTDTAFSLEFSAPHASPSATRRAAVVGVTVPRHGKVCMNDYLGYSDDIAALVLSNPLVMKSVKNGLMKVFVE